MLHAPCRSLKKEWRKIKNKDVDVEAAALTSRPAMQQQQQQQQRQQQQGQQWQHRWRATLSWGRRKPTPEPPQPCPRWKAASAQLAGGLGLLVNGGDSPTKEGPLFRNDTWLLRFPDLRWQQASISGGEGEGQLGPRARRSHSLVSYQVRQSAPMPACACHAAKLPMSSGSCPSLWM